MRSPEQQNIQKRQQHHGKKLETDPQMHYLSPGAFTVLPIEGEEVPDPPKAPPPYRLPVTKKSFKNPAFAIIGEVGSNPASRSPSPTGRVSPFRGHGFNPAGSRHVSPSSSPEPQIKGTRNRPPLAKKPSSKIPKLNSNGTPRERKSSTGALFGEKVIHDGFVGKNLSQTTSNLEDDKKKALSPRKKLLKGAYKQLSPIQGSSPEPSQSSPSRNKLKSQSTPPSRRTSPTREVKMTHRSRSRPNLATKTSPLASPMKTPKNNKYQHVQSKINNGNRSSRKPSIESEESVEKSPKKLIRKPSSSNLKSRKSESELDKTKKNSPKKEPSAATTSRLEESMKPLPKLEEVATPRDDTDDEQINTRKVGSADSIPSALDVVSSTTNTVTKPLKIETPKLGRTTKPVSPMIDGRVLSATSVSQAINKMNDTVLNTQTLIKDSGLQSRYPLTPSVAPIKNEPINSDNPPMKTVEENDTFPLPTNHSIHNNNNHVTTVGLGNAKAIENEVHNNMGLNNHKSVNDRIREARTVIADDVKPIKITVQEKPSDADVQSGNVAPHFGVANGVNERPSPSAMTFIYVTPLHEDDYQQNGYIHNNGLPHQQVVNDNVRENEEETAKEVPQSRCGKFWANCGKALACGSGLAMCCRKCVKKNENLETMNEEDEEKTGCCSCLRRKKNKEPIEVSDEETTSKSCWQKLNCCKRNKVGDSQSCFPLGKRKSSWTDQSTIAEPKRNWCKQFLRALFCCAGCTCSACCKKKDEEDLGRYERKESMVSSKKKSLTPMSGAPPPAEETHSKIDASLVEHNSHMKAAIPVLPVWLAWFCCVMNCIGPGTGTVLSGLFCLCIGKPRFSQKDGPRPRIGAFIIDLIIGFSQFFTVLFCLVGWGWSIWWGVMMVKLAKKHKKLKHLEQLEENAGKPHPLAGQHKRDLERGGGKV